MTLGTGCIGDDGTIVISGGHGVAPGTLRFTLARNVEAVNYWLPIVISGVLALIFVLVVGWIRRNALAKTVLTGPSWSFTDSWLTNISTVGATWRSRGSGRCGPGLVAARAPVRPGRCVHGVRGSDPCSLVPLRAGAWSPLRPARLR